MAGFTLFQLRGSRLTHQTQAFYLRIQFTFSPVRFAIHYAVHAGRLLRSLMDIIVFNYFIIRFCDFYFGVLDRKLTIMIKEGEAASDDIIDDSGLVLLGAHTVNRQSIKWLKGSSALKDMTKSPRAHMNHGQRINFF